MNGQLQVKAVLKRGLEYGILRKYRRQYYLPTSNELNRANRIALRFAKLPLPSAYQTKSRSVYSTLRSRRRRNSRRSEIVKSSRKPRQLVDVSSTLISPTVSLANTICNVDDLWTIPWLEGREEEKRSRVARVRNQNWTLVGRWIIGCEKNSRALTIIEKKKKWS